ncbi:MAG: 30S ribosomal protein S6 [Candidatus Levybacteria bacterium]|nr:30S ribosomal protein S6 [Candidatus Levybacteria bacterium]
MRTYELVLVLKTSLTKDKVKKLIGEIGKWLKDIKIVKQDELGEKELAFKIKKETRGIFLDLKLEGKDVVSSDFEKRIREEADILRHLLLREQ